MVDPLKGELRSIVRKLPLAPEGGQVRITSYNGCYTKLLREISAHGHVVIKRAYGDWSSDYLKNWKEHLNELAIQPVQQFAYTVGKNATDASMIIV